MGKRGPRPRPATLHRLKGTFRGDRHGGREPEAPGPLLRPRRYLNPQQRRRFRQILAEAPRNLLRRMDAPSVAGFIVAESLLAEATEARARKLDNGALLDRSEHGQIILDALVKLQLRALAAMKPYIDMLGFSPSSRANMAVDDDDRYGEDDWTDWDELMRASDEEKKKTRRALAALGGRLPEGPSAYPIEPEGPAEIIEAD